MWVAVILKGRNETIGRTLIINPKAATVLA